MKSRKFLVVSTIALSSLAALTAGCESGNVPLAKAPSTETAPPPPATTQGNHGKAAPPAKNQSRGDPTELTK